MMLAISALKGFTIEANDGRIGTVRDFLFNDATWKIMDGTHSAAAATTSALIHTEWV